MLLDENLRKQEDDLRKRMSRFVDSQALPILADAMPNATAGNSLEETAAAIRGMDPFTSAELLIALTEVKDSRLLLNPEFLNSIRCIDPFISSALLYEIRITGNAKALTDQRIFNHEAELFFSRLGPEAASEWFNSIGRTDNVTDLTSSAVLSSHVLDAVAEKSRIASELSYAIGETHKVEKLTSPEFMDFIGSLETSVAAEYLSAIWCTKRPDELTSKGIMERIASGEADVWKDIARSYARGNTSQSNTIVISRPGGDAHDRGAKLIIQFLFDNGYDVRYVGNSASYEEIVQTAISEHASAIGFSLSGDSNLHTVAEVMRHMKGNGLGNVAIFGGGMMTHDQTVSFERAGVKLFSKNVSYKGIADFLSANAMRLSLGAGADAAGTRPTSTSVSPGFAAARYEAHAKSMLYAALFAEARMERIRYSKSHSQWQAAPVYAEWKAVDLTQPNPFSKETYGNRMHHALPKKPKITELGKVSCMPNASRAAERPEKEQVLIELARTGNVAPSVVSMPAQAPTKGNGDAITLQTWSYKLLHPKVSMKSIRPGLKTASQAVHGNRTHAKMVDRAPPNLAASRIPVPQAAQYLYSNQFAVILGLAAAQKVHAVPATLQSSNRTLSISFSGTAHHPIKVNHNPTIAAIKGSSLRIDWNNALLVPVLPHEEYGALHAPLSSLAAVTQESLQKLLSDLKGSIIPKAAAIVMAASCTYLARQSLLVVKLLLHL